MTRGYILLEVRIQNKTLHTYLSIIRFQNHSKHPPTTVTTQEDISVTPEKWHEKTPEAVAAPGVL